MYNIKEYGAIGNGETLDSPAIQRAIEACAAAGGGTVFIPAGQYLCGTVHLKSHIHLLFEEGATVLGSKNPTDFDPLEKDASNTEFQDRSHSYFHHSLFHADGAEEIVLSGYGKIDMQSAWEETGSLEDRTYWCRCAKAIAFKECRDVVIRDLLIRNVADLAVYVAGCERVLITGLNIRSHVDGISPDSCKNVVISDCMVDTGDDAIVPKCSYTLGRMQPMENLTITGCVVRSSASAIKFGTESNSAFINITISNCTIYDTRISGISFKSADGALIESVSVSNVTMRNVGAPLLIMANHRLRAPQGTPIGKIKNISVSGLVITGPYPETFQATMPQNALDYKAGKLTLTPFRKPLIVAGCDESRIENVSLSNILFSSEGGGTEADRLLPVNEAGAKNPSPWAFGQKLPVYGLFARCVDNLRLYNVSFTTEKPDARDAIQLDRVSGFKEV